MEQTSLFLSLIRLCLSGGDEDKDFDIQRNMGTISIACRLDAARRSNYNMTVRVTDGHHTATTQVRNMTFSKTCLMFETSEGLLATNWLRK